MHLIAEIKLLGTKAAPWVPARIIPLKGGKQWHKKDPALIAWQDAIRAEMTREGPRTPYTGPVMLCTTFLKGTADETLWGMQWWSSTPKRGEADATNLLKAAEDAIKTFRLWVGRGKARVLKLEIPGVIEEDSQVCDQFTRKRWGPEDGVEIRVYGHDEPAAAGG